MMRIKVVVLKNVQWACLETAGFVSAFLARKIAKTVQIHLIAHFALTTLFYSIKIAEIFALMDSFLTMKIGCVWKIALCQIRI